MVSEESQKTCIIMSMCSDILNKSELAIKEDPAMIRRSTLTKRLRGLLDGRTLEEVTVETRSYPVVKCLQICKRYSQAKGQRNALHEADFEIEYLMLPSAWLHIRGWSKRTTRYSGQDQYTFTPLSIISDQALIFQTCKAGDLDEVIHLTTTRQASVFDMSQNGCTLLHVSSLS